MKGRKLTENQTSLVRLCGALDMTKDETLARPELAGAQVWNVTRVLRESRPPPVPTDWLPED